MGDIDPTKEAVEQPDATAEEDGVQPVEGFVDPFEEEWDDATMKESHKEWERLLADAAEQEINSLNPSATPPGPPGDPTNIAGVD